MPGTGYRLLFDHGLTRLDPERAHHLAFAGIRAATAVSRRLPVPRAPVTAMGLQFAHPLGLAAGFDKNATGIDALAALGFSHIEVGTVTGRAQPGNERPRLFRLTDDHAVVNRMGFNNDGAAAVAQRLALRRSAQAAADRALHRPVLGINIGKTKLVDDADQAAVEADYRLSAGLLAPYADYLVVNVSSPNTPGLRSLQSVERLAPLLRAVRDQADRASADKRVPLLVKIAPDLADEDVVAVGELAVAEGLDGVIATNTTIAREGLRTSPEEVAAIGAGGLSGAPLRERSLAVLRLLRRTVGPELTLIGVGGIGNGQDAIERIAAGATLLQAYTGFIYGGASWPRVTARALASAGGVLGEQRSETP